MTATTTRRMLTMLALTALAVSLVPATAGAAPSDGGSTPTTTGSARTVLSQPEPSEFDVYLDAFDPPDGPGLAKPEVFTGPGGYECRAADEDFLTATFDRLRQARVLPGTIAITCERNGDPTAHPGTVTILDHGVIWTARGRVQTFRTESPSSGCLLVERTRMAALSGTARVEVAGLGIDETVSATPGTITRVTEICPPRRS